MSDNFPELQKSSGIIVNDTYSYINNTNFYSLANATFYDYYYRVIRRCAWWVDGYVFNFHNQHNGIFSTRLASSLVKGLSNTIMGERILFKQVDDLDNRSLEAINEWSEEVNFQATVRKSINYATALGTSLLKINKSKKDYWAEAIRLDYFYFTSDYQDRLEEVVVLIKHYNNMMAKDTKANGDEKNYYLVERRYFKTEKVKKIVDVNGVKQVHEQTKKQPMVEFLVKVYTGNTMSMQTYDPSRSGSVRWDSLPANIKRAIKSDYSVMEIGIPQRLPFAESLGCELVKFGVGDISLPQTPFGTPIIYDILSDLMAYDLAFSYFTRDMYMGKGTVLMPKGMTQPGSQTNALSGLDSAMFELYESTDPDKQKPISVQFDLRAESWERIQDNLLRKIATKIGMSPKTIASYLSTGQTMKTATEIDSEDDSTIAYIEIQRSSFVHPINRIIEEILNQKGYSGDVKVTFSTPSLVNKDKIIDRALKLYDAGLIDELETLRMVFPEDSESNLKGRAEDFMKRVNEKKSMMPFDLGG